MATKNESGEYMETVIKLRDFLFDYSWLFNFSNIDIIKLDLVKTTLPKDWHEYISKFSSVTELKQVLRQDIGDEVEFLSNTFTTMPTTFAKFVQRRNELSQNLATLIPQWNKTNSEFDINTYGKIKTQNVDRFLSHKDEDITKLVRGMSPKKQHEVMVFTRFIHEQFETILSASQNFVIDIGSGLGYLDQLLWYLHNYQVIGIESSQEHNQRAEARNLHITNLDDKRKPKHLTWDLENTDENTLEISRIIEAEQMDIKRLLTNSAIHKVNDQSNDALHPHIGQNDMESTTNSVLVALHACGDLSSAALKLFTSDSSILGIGLVSCCYHKMKEFPISKTFEECLDQNYSRYLDTIAPKADYSCIKSTYALRLASQEPFQRWCNLNEIDHEERGCYLGYRALLEALSDSLNAFNSERVQKSKQKIVKLKRRGITKTQMKTYETFKENALKRFDFGLDGVESSKVNLEKELNSLHEIYKHQFRTFECIVGLQNFVQELLEAFVLLDKYFYLQEKGLFPTILKIFDGNISPRNTVIFCMK